MVPLMRIVIEGLGGKFNSFFHIWDLFSREKQSCLSLVSTSISRKMEGKNNHYSTLLLCTYIPLAFALLAQIRPASKNSLWAAQSCSSTAWPRTVHLSATVLKDVRKFLGQNKMEFLLKLNTENSTGLKAIQILSILTMAQDGKWPTTVIVILDFPTSLPCPPQLFFTLRAE